MDLAPSSGATIAGIPGNSVREVEIHDALRKIKHSWCKNGGNQVKVTSVLLGVKGIKASGTPLTAFVENDMALLGSTCTEHADLIRARTKRARSAAALGAPPAPKRRGRGEVPIDPVIAAAACAPRAARTGRSNPPSMQRKTRRSIDQGQGGASSRGGSSARAQENDIPMKSIVSAADIRDALQQHPALLKELRLTWGCSESQTAAMAEAGVHAAATRESAASLESLRSNLGTEIGRQTYQAALSVVAGTGEHSGGVSAAKRAAILRVRPNTLLDAQERMRRARHDITPSEALEKGVYVYHVRKTRSDATAPALTALMRQFWHSDDVSRATDDREIYRESQAWDAPRHPRRQLTLQVVPKVQRCTCQIHTQQELYLTALKLYLKAAHPDGCKCKCASCAEGCGKWQNMCQNLATFYDSVAPCEKVNLLGGDPLGEAEFTGRKPDCVKMKCAECGFGKAIPECSAWEGFGDHPVVTWMQLGDLKRDDGTVLKKQPILVNGTVKQLWSEFKVHSAKYMEHAAKQSRVAAQRPQHQL